MNNKLFYIDNTSILFFIDNVAISDTARELFKTPHYLRHFKDAVILNVFLDDLLYKIEQHLELHDVNINAHNVRDLINSPSRALISRVKLRGRMAIHDVISTQGGLSWGSLYAIQDENLVSAIVRSAENENALYINKAIYELDQDLIKVIGEAIAILQQTSAVNVCNCVVSADDLFIEYIQLSQAYNSVSVGFCSNTDRLFTQALNNLVEASNQHIPIENIWSDMTNALDSEFINVVSEFSTWLRSAIGNPSCLYSWMSFDVDYETEASGYVVVSSDINYKIAYFDSVVEARGTAPYPPILTTLSRRYL